MPVGFDSPLHILILLLVVLLVFGGKRLPEIGRGIGTSLREFKNSVTGQDAKREALPAARPPSPPADEPES